jgi:hypothetical protein
VRQRQANIRLDEATYELLEIAAFLNRRSFSDELRTALLAWIETFDKQDLEAAGRLRKKLVAEIEQTGVSSLDKKRIARGRNG